MSVLSHFATFCNCFRLAGLIFHKIFFLKTHPSTFIIKLFIFTLTELCRVVIHQKLLRYRPLLLLFRQSISHIGDTATFDYCTNLEVLRQVFRIVVFVEALGENLISKLDRLQVIL